MRRRHRMHTVLAIGCTTALTAACSGSAGGDGAQESVSIVMVQGVTGLPFAKIAAQGAKDAAAEVGGVDFKVQGPANIDSAAEVKIFQQVVSTRPDGIVLQELPPNLFTRPVEDAVESGITVLPYTIAPEKGSVTESFVGDDGRDLGRMAADRLAEEFTEEHGPDVSGEIVTGICVPGLSVLTQRLDGFKERMAEKLPNVKVLDPFDSKGDPAENYNVWKRATETNPDALAMISPCEADNQNLVKIKERANASWVLTPFDLDDEILQGVKDGTVLAVFPQSSYLHGYAATRLLAETLKAGEELPKGWVKMPIVPIDAGNVDEIIKRESSFEEQKKFWAPYVEEIFSSDPIATEPLEQVQQ